MLTVGSNVAPSHPSSVVRLPSSNRAFQPRLCDLGHSRSARIAGFTSTNGTFEPDCVIQSTAGALELNDTASSHDLKCDATKCEEHSVMFDPSAAGHTAMSLAMSSESRLGYIRAIRSAQIGAWGVPDGLSATLPLLPYRIMEGLPR